MSVSGDILRSWRRPRQVVRDLLAQGPREDRALVFLTVGCGVIFLGQWPRMMRLAAEPDAPPLQAMLGATLLGWFFMAPLIFYGLAALIRLGMLAVGLRVRWFATRLAVFWALLAASPLWMLNGMVDGLLGPGPVASAVGLVGLAAFFWILGGGLGAAVLEARGQRA